MHPLTWPLKLLVGGLFSLTGILSLIKDERLRRKAGIGGMFLAIMGLSLIQWQRGFPPYAPKGSLIPFGSCGGELLSFLLAAIPLLAWLGEGIYRKRVMLPSHFALAGAGVLFLFSPDVISLLSAWLLIDLLLTFEEGRERLSTYLLTSGAGLSSFLAAWITYPSISSKVLLILAASIRAGFFPWPGRVPEALGSRLLPLVTALHLLRSYNPGLPGWITEVLTIWLAIGLLRHIICFAFGGGEWGQLPPCLWGYGVLASIYGWKVCSLALLFSLLAGAGMWRFRVRLRSLVKLLPIKAIKRPASVSLDDELASLINRFGDFWEGETGWMWILLGGILYLFNLKGISPPGKLELLWHRLFPMGLGMMASSFLLILTEVESVLLFTLLAQYIMAAFNLTNTSSYFLPVLIRIITGAWVCILLYLSKWGARWLRPGRTQKASSSSFLDWLLRAILGMGAGFLAYVITFRWRLSNLPLESQFIILWLILLGLFNALTPGRTIRRIAGILTLLTGFDTFYALSIPGFSGLALFGTIQIMVALAATFLVAYEKAGTGNGGV